jgi:NADH-quinone oxidoreductase subunit J
MRRREGVKSQDPGQQVRVSRNDRMRVVRMASEKKLALKSILQDNKD